MYVLQGALHTTGNPPSEAIPWMVGYLKLIEQRRGPDNPETHTSL